MSSSQLKFNRCFAVATVALFATELLIALFARGFVRNHLGDVLVVMLMYCFVRSFYQGCKRSLPLYLFVFAVMVEVAQACNLIGLLSLQKESALGIVIGSSFDWGDIVSYGVGSALCYVNYCSILRR